MHPAVRFLFAGGQGIATMAGDAGVMILRDRFQTPVAIAAAGIIGYFAAAGHQHSTDD